MRFLFLATLLFSAVFFVMPETTLAQGIVPCGTADNMCQTCHFIELGNNVLEWIIGVMTSICAIIIVIAGFKMVMAAGNPGAISEAKGMITNTLVGFIILLAAWLIVDTVLKVFVSGSSDGTDGAAEIPGFGPWNEIACVKQPEVTPPVDACATAENPDACRCEARGGALGTDGKCSVDEITLGACKYTLSTYSGIEEGSPLQWANTNSALQSCAAKELGSVSSAYRTDAYQTHLYALWFTWCKDRGGLQNDSTLACASVKTSVSAEISKHQLRCDRLVAKGASNHAEGIAVDINGGGPKRDTACFKWFGPRDEVHYTLKNVCYGDCNPNN